MVAIVPLILGWLSNIVWVGPWLAGLLMVPVVFLSIGIGWCAAITLLGFPLSVCAIVSEKGADAYDGISRSAAYTFQRPLTLGLCIIAAQVLSSIGGAFLIGGSRYWIFGRIGRVRCWFLYFDSGL